MAKTQTEPDEFQRLFAECIAEEGGLNPNASTIAWGASLKLAVDRSMVNVSLSAEAWALIDRVVRHCIGLMPHVFLREGQSSHWRDGEKAMLREMYATTRTLVQEARKVLGSTTRDIDEMEVFCFTNLSSIDSQENEPVIHRSRENFLKHTTYLRTLVAVLLGPSGDAFTMLYARAIVSLNEYARLVNACQTSAN